MIMAPLAAFTMAGILFVYTRSSIRAAKSNVQNRRYERRHISNEQELQAKNEGGSTPT
jgi:hypothetical protein